MKRWLGLILLLTGLTTTLYSFSDWHQAKSSVEKLTTIEIEEYEQLEKITYKKRKNHPLPSPAAEKLTELETPIATTSISHQLGEKAASLIIPKLEQKYSIFWGTDEATLEQGVGMFVSDLTTVPGGKGHTVLSGHRDTVFTGLGKLTVKDQLIIEYSDKIYVYEIMETWITDKNDRTVIVEKEEDTLTLTTCYPFDYVGYAPNRYIIQAKLISTSSV